jgi:hypothetical protein
MNSSGTSRLVRRIIACAAIGALAASCADDDDSSTATTAATATAASTAASTSTGGSAAPSDDVCADREALRSSVAALNDVNLRAEGTNGVTAAINAVKDDLAALRTSAGDKLRLQVQAVQDAIDQLETAVGNLGSGGGAEAATAVSNLVSAAGTLLDSPQAGACGASTTPTT